MSLRATTIASTHFATALLGCTILAGVPAVAYAQDGGEAPAPAPTSTPAPAAAAPSEQADTIRTIAVSGAQRLEAQTILSYISLRPGQAYTAAAADQALKDLAATELFSDYRIRNNGGDVVIEIVENPVINRIVLEGNKKLKDDKILPEIKLSPRQIFTRSKVRADVARIIELYKRQGRFAAVVEPKMVELSQNRVDIVFEITEGPKSKVRAINIIGNDAFSDGELRGEMVTKEAGLLKIFSSGTSYDPDRLAFDQQKLRQFYLTEGYADFRVVSAVAELTPDKKDFIITYVVEEGDRYKFGDVKVESQIRDFNSEALTRTLPMHEGDWYDAKMVEDTIERLAETAGTFGYAFADVRPDFDRSRENLTMGVNFVIAESARTYVEQIDVNGNTLTQDKVVRREFRLSEGDAFNSLQVRRSTARINSLGYFQENFEIDQVDGSAPDRIILEANVQEQPTGELSLSAGFSSLESFIFQGAIRQNNFRGRGQTVGLNLNYSRYSRAGSISFTEPYLFDKSISAGVDVYRRDYNNGYYDRSTATYEQKTTGFQTRVGIPITEVSSVLGRYTLNFDDVTVAEDRYFSDLDGDGIRTCEPLLVGRYLCDTLGKRTSSILGLSLIYNTLDNRVRPTRGRAASAGIDFAGLGGNVKYLRLSANASQFWSVGGGFIASLTAESGYIKGLEDRGPGQNDVYLTDRFFLGESQMRGFDIRGIGPRIVRRYYIPDGNGGTTLTDLDDDRTQDDALGGTGYYRARAELEIPLGSGAREMGIRPSIFVDAGAVFGLETPQLYDFPNGFRQQALNGDGDPLYSGPDGPTTSPTRENSDGETVDNAPIYSINLPAFREEYLGDTPKPRVSIGIGVNWNSPFGPFRIDLAYPLLKVEGDETKTFSFNVGTQF